ncbi:hypothetical protein C7212DRAFT_205472 [Tuber magnatum]|uniref:Uncharacterized protein n=1 Tax=Tuber magnatum TaxID=42249 RepID=A0A317SKQ2_9PEZI|nr:hypothetical protein C7212DRAFT_205472 [Tuber magnatum]
MLPPSSSLLTLLTLITSSLANPNAQRIRAKRLLFPRQNSSFGGWGLRMVNCPTETQKCGTNDGCCPKDMICITSSLMGALACCPTKESCGEVIRTLPVCADPGWTLWKNDGQNPFCCLPGQFGYQTVGSDSSCAEPDMPVPSSLLATSLVPANGASATGSPRTSKTGTSTRGRSATATPNSEGGSAEEAAGGDSSASAGSSNTSKSGLSTGATAGIGVAAGIIGVALIGGGIWWGFKKGQQKGREGQVVVENFVPAPEYTADGHGGGARSAEGVVGAGARDKPVETTQVPVVYRANGSGAEMQG